MSEQSEPAMKAPSSDHRLWRWGLVAGILGVTTIVVVVLVLRAIPKEGEAQVEIGGWKVPVGVVVNTDSASSHLPGIVVNTLLGNKPVIQINAGRVQAIDRNEIRIKSWSGGGDATYKLTDSTKTLNVRGPLLSASTREGDSVAVMTSPDSNDALIVLTGVTLLKN